ncbi:acyl carrier protein [Streptomyces sp. CB01881]|uniref:acyl carrier protein n=1 Tax=Streptomyces sp. CB01881 TaxID=2078691 RepID=UPI000CDC540C|nr:acyl carrier protein [Streptomyces sp. CB01881]AUY52698.1 actinorhodin polyketide synthase [Streptomyces sp. CB01881]TYC70416.1 acyl carrier protein [Streptomyces sp. CB01881]
MPTSSPFTLDDLRRILLEGAGAEDGVDLTGDIIDTEFTALGYDSLALLETSGRIEREYDISLDDSAVADAATPRGLIDTVNTQLSAASNA